MLKVGDKVLYIGDERPYLGIKTSTVYTIKELVPFEGLCLEELHKEHSYDIIHFILATDLTEALT